jgi:hypothetical protein
MSEDSVNATREIGVIQLRLPYIDSRSLSQAWFSALHLASDAKAPAVARRRAQASVAGAAAAAAAEAPAAPERAAASPRAEKAALRGHGAAPGEPDPASRPASRPARERMRAAALSERAAACSYPPVRAAFAFGLDGARVQIMVRRDGPTLHVLALCAPRHVELVRRALACADVHLRARGEALRSSVRALGVEEVRA